MFATQKLSNKSMKACDKDSAATFANIDLSLWSVSFLLPVCARRGLLVEHLLHVADFTLHLPACFFHRAAIAQVWIPCRLAGRFFHVAFRFPKSALDLIPCARFHKNKIARYEFGGCNMIEIEGDLQTNKKGRESPLPLY
jgi:hypothetical protein